MQVNVLCAKNQLSQLIRSAQAGERVIIANRGVPVAQLIPIKASSQALSQQPTGNFLTWLDGNPLPAARSRPTQRTSD